MLPQSSPKQAVESARHRLQSLGTPERAAKEKVYLKSNLQFLGVTVPGLRREAKAFSQSHPTLPPRFLEALCQEAWSQDIHELRSWSIFILALHTASLDKSDLRWLEALARQAKTWAHIDELATAVIAPVVERDEKTHSILRRWAKDSDFWIRRTSLLALLPALRRGEGHFDLFESLSVPLLSEKEFFIRKAIGWILREVSKRRPNLSFDYLTAHRSQVSGLTLREGAKYLTERQKKSLGLAR